MILLYLSLPQHHMGNISSWHSGRQTSRDTRTGSFDIELYKQRKFRLDIRKRFFTERVVGCWNRFPREVVTAPNLSEFKEYLNNALSHMIQF